jgi:sulfate adenylyltransferase subunit 2
MALTHLDRLEAESIAILRETVAVCRRPVMLYSVGKDSSVMLALARKAFVPGPLPFPLLHIATGWDFRAVIAHRDAVVAQHGAELIVRGGAERLHPFTVPLATYSRAMLTDPLRAALAEGGYDAAFGGGRRDEEKARAKERIFSFRARGGGWDPRHQRPEPWGMLNGHLHEGESLRVFPLSNWTERDVWDYAAREAVPLVPLYFADARPTVQRGSMLLMVDDPTAIQLQPGEEIVERRVRFRTMGCWPLTGAHESNAESIEQVIAEVAASRSSERAGRAVDGEASASMEAKKKEGYF